MKSAILLFSLCLIVITNKVNARPQFNPLNPKEFSSRIDVKHQIGGQFPKKRSILYQSLPGFQPKPKHVPISILSKLILSKRISILQYQCQTCRNRRSRTAKRTFKWSYSQFLHFRRLKLASKFDNLSLLTLVSTIMISICQPYTCIVVVDEY